jgi:hypothetical protein
LFEWYLRNFASYSPHLKLQRAVRRRPDRNSSIDASTNNALMESEASKYYGYLLYHMNSVSAKAMRQFFYSTFTAKYYGLSNRGLDVLSKYGYSSKLTYFHEHIKNQHSVATQKVR